MPEYLLTLGGHLHEHFNCVFNFQRVCLLCNLTEDFSFIFISL